MITTIYTYGVQLEKLLRNHEYEQAIYVRRQAFRFLDDVFSFWKRLRIKKMYLFNANYDCSIDLEKVAKDVAVLKQKYHIDVSQDHQPTYKPIRYYTSDCTTDHNKDNDVYLYDVSTFV